jgi:Cellulose synthase subunit D
MDQQAPAISGRAGAVQWRVFLRALADEVDTLAGASERDDMLRGIGRRMGRMVPLPGVTSLEALEVEMNDALEVLGWGSVRLRLHEGERTLYVTHSGLPRIGSLGNPSGQWLSALLEGLYEVWFAQQPGHQPSLIARRVENGNPDAVIMRYARG